jgi:anthranilate/para-aminobenzoate synthase component II
MACICLLHGEKVQMTDAIFHDTSEIIKKQFKSICFKQFKTNISATAFEIALKTISKHDINLQPFFQFSLKLIVSSMKSVQKRIRLIFFI